MSTSTRICWRTEALIASGRTAPMYHAWSRPKMIEREATHRAIALAEMVDQPIQVFHVSCSEVAEEIGRMKKGEFETTLTVHHEDRFEAWAWPGLLLVLAGFSARLTDAQVLLPYVGRDLPPPRPKVVDELYVDETLPRSLFVALERTRFGSDAPVAAAAPRGAGAKPAKTGAKR
jgi:hypothetical protein